MGLSVTAKIEIPLEIAGIQCGFRTTCKFPLRNTLFLILDGLAQVKHNLTVAMSLIKTLSGFRKKTTFSNPTAVVVV